MKLRADYRSFQALNDLRAVLQHCNIHQLAESAALEKQFQTHQKSDGFSDPELQISTEMYATLYSMVFSEIKNLDEFTFGVSALLIIQLLGGRGFDEPENGWDLLKDPIQAVPHPRRSAILRGFYRLFQLSGGPMPSPIIVKDCQSSTFEKTQEALAQLFENPPLAELEYIARADRGWDADKHLSALKRVIFEQAGKMPQDQNWFPSEVVELTGYDPTAWGFTTCTALLLYNDADQTGTEYGTEFRWANFAQNYCDMKSPERRVILDGFRFLLEIDPEWNPYAEWPQSKLDRVGIAIPYFDK